MRAHLYVTHGIPVNEQALRKTIARIEGFVHVGRTTGKTHRILIVNSTFLVGTIRDPELRYLWQMANLALGDGIFRFISPSIEKDMVEAWIPGKTLIPALIKLASRQKYSLFLLGRDGDRTERVVARLQENVPDLVVSGVSVNSAHDPLAIDWESVDAVNNANPDILMVDFGNPDQEKWIGLHGAHLNVPVTIGYNGFLEMLAEQYVSRSTREAGGGLRLIHEGWGGLLRHVWNQHIVAGFNTVIFLIWSAWEKIRGRSDISRALSAGSSNFENFSAISTRLRGITWLIIRGPGYLDANAAPELERAGLSALSHNPFLILDLSETIALTSSGVRTLSKLHQTALQNHGGFRIVNTSEDINRVIQLLGFDKILEVYPDITVATA